MILNLKKLNQYASKTHFKMDTLNTIIKLIEKDCYMASIDLKDAYYCVNNIGGQEISPFYVTGFTFPVHLLA